MPYGQLPYHIAQCKLSVTLQRNDSDIGIVGADWGFTKLHKKTAYCRPRSRIKGREMG